MAMQKMTGKEIREHFEKKGGKIVHKGHGNFVLPCFAHIAPEECPAPRTAIAVENETTDVRLRLTMQNRDPDVTDPVIGKNTYHALSQTPILNDANPVQYNATFTAPGDSEFWFDQSFTVENVPVSTTNPAHQTTLMDFIQNYVDDGVLASPASYIKFPVKSGSTPDITASFIRSLNFGGSGLDTDTAHRFLYDEGSYDFDPVTGEGSWSGWGWMYFIGDHETPVLNQPDWDSTLNPELQPNTSYPGLYLNQYTLARLLAEIAGGGYGDIFTLSYEKSRFVFQTNSATENGEVVHRVTCKHVPTK